MNTTTRSSSATDLLLSVTRVHPKTLARQIEEQIRSAIRNGALSPGTPLPSTRDLARQLDVSRGVIVNAYAQLSAEGYVILRQGARPVVSDSAATHFRVRKTLTPRRAARYDFSLGVPDVSKFPRAEWIRSVRTALAEMPSSDLGYGDERGVESLRTALAAYLGRVRDVVSDIDRVVVTSGYLQAHTLVCRALAAIGAKRIAFEDPSDIEPRITAQQAGLEVVPVGVDDEGLRVDALERADVQAVVLTPAHQFPTGVLLSPARRAALVAWLRKNDAIAIEDDYDAEFRYDGSPVGALQGLDPDRVVYAGSASKILAPALRIGWLVLPDRLVDRVRELKSLADRGTTRIEQAALGDFVARGQLDRHLRRMRIRYRRQRDALVAGLTAAIPRVRIRGIAAGLHAAAELPDDLDEAAILCEAERRRVVFRTMRYFAIGNQVRPPTLLLGYGHTSESVIRSGVKELAAIVRATQAD